MGRELIKVSEVEDRAVKLSLDNPPVNVVTIELLKQLRTYLRGCKQDRSINVVVINGIGKCFSAGADVGEHLPGKFQDMLPALRDVMLELLTYPKITVSSVHGYALGGGFELAIATDFIVAEESATFSLPEIQLAVFPPIATAWLPYMVGHKTANKLILTACELKPATLKEMGIVNHVVKDGELASFTSEFCGRLTKMSLSAIENAKRSMKRYQETLAVSLDSSIESYAKELMKCHDPVEGLKSFMEKRKPEWRHQ